MATYLLRTNLDIKDTKKEANSIRFLASINGVRFLINNKKGNKNKLVIISHRGRPEGRDESLSLRPLVKLFDKKLKRKVIFLDNADLGKVRLVVEESKPGSIFLLENVRFLKGETDNNPVLAKELASLGDIFVNDDFATAHRKNASNVGITKFLPSKMGPNLRKEVKNLTKAIQNPKHPFVIILGGAKMEDKIGVINNLIGKADYILLGGGVANTVLKSNGVGIGTSIYDSQMIGIARNLSKNKKMVIPVDYLRDGEGDDFKILDIGPKTIKLYSDIIKKAKTIIWGGPMGYCEDKRFAKGSYAIAKAIASSKGFSVVGGGDTTAIITHLKLDKKIGFVSTGGGAMLDFLAGAKMPALAALQRKSETRNSKSETNPKSQ